MTSSYYGRIQRIAGVVGGQAVIHGTRVTVRTVLASLAEGATIEDVLTEFPTLTEADVYAVIVLAAALAQKDLERHV